MTSPEAPYASNDFERQVSPLLVAAGASVAIAASTALAVALRSWFPLAVAYPISLFAALGFGGLRRRGALRIDAQGVWWRGARVVARDAIVHVAREREAVSVRTESSLRSVHRFYAPDEDAAKAMVRALGEADDRPAVELSVSSPAAAWGTTPYFALMALPLAWTFGALVLRANGNGSPWLLAHLAAAIATLSLLFVPTRITLGADGMQVRWLWRTRWIPWRDVASVDSIAKSVALVLHLKGAETLRISSEAAFALTDANASEDLVTRIRKAIAAAAEARTHAITAALSRGDASTAEWVSRLRALVDGGAGGYRSVPIAPEDLAVALRDHGADPSLRGAAAVAYAPAGGAAAVRSEAEAVASTRVRVALDAAAEGDEVAITAALDALEAER